jgi:hypothetical protein
MIDKTPIDDDVLPGNDNVSADKTITHPMIGEGMPRTDAEYSERTRNAIAAADEKYKLRARDRLFLQYYLDRSCKDTYLKPSAALRAANADKQLNYDTRASQILKRLRAVGAYGFVLECIGAGVEVRLYRLAEVASGEAEIEEIVYDADGSIKTRKTKQPTFREQIAAIQELNKMDGTYSKLRAVARVQDEHAKDEYRRLRDAARKAIEDAASGRRIAPERKRTRKDAPIIQRVELQEDRAEDAI